MIDERAGDGDALALPARQFVRPVRHAVGQVNCRQRLLGLLVSFGGADARINQRQLDVVQAVARASRLKV